MEMFVDILNPILKQIVYNLCQMPREGLKWKAHSEAQRNEDLKRKARPLPDYCGRCGKGHALNKREFIIIKQQKYLRLPETI